MILTAIDVKFTRGSPFGEQWWTFEDDNHIVHTYAMWEDLKSPLWPKIGQKVEIEVLPPVTCSMGGGTEMKINNCACIIRVIDPE